MAAAAVPAFAAPPPSSGQITGTVTVATALTLELQDNAFTVSNASPGVLYNGIPATIATVLTNGPGYTLTAAMNDATVSATVPNPGNCDTDAFNDATAAHSIPDSQWAITSTGGPGAPGATPQAFTEEHVTSAYNGNNGYTCAAADPVAVQLGTTTNESAPSGDVFTVDPQVTVPANTPGGDAFTGALTVAAVG
jgi:hypothetical protein